MFIFAGGGEPLLNNNLFDYIDAIGDCGFSSWVTTNGRLLDDIKIDRLVNSRLNKLEVSCLGINETEYIESTGIGGFSSVLDNIQNLSRALRRTNNHIDFHVVSYSLKTIKSPDNEIEQFWASLDIDFLGPLPVINRGGILKNFQHIVDDTQGALPMATTVDFSQRIWCYYPNYFDFIDSEGNYLPCSAYFFENSKVILGHADSDPLKLIYDRYEYYLCSKSLHQMCRDCYRVHDNWPVDQFLKRHKLLA